VGTKKTLWVNFQEICQTMGRSSDHVFQFMMAELGTEGSIDGNKRLVIRGKFVPKVSASRIPYVNGMKAIAAVVQRVTVEVLVRGCDSIDLITKLYSHMSCLPLQYIESLLRKYIGEYVACQMCRSFKTNLTRDNVSRLFFVSCQVTKCIFHWRSSRAAYCAY
jgi:translation initiation factor 2 subunit 2